MEKSKQPLKSVIAYEKLREMILSYELSGTIPWSVRELAKRFGMSSVPVYAAMQRLEHEGSITILPKRGIVVTRLTEDQFRQAYVVREGLEVQAARIVATCGTQEMFDELTRLAEDIVKLVKKDDSPGVVAADRRLHKRMVELAGCDMLTERYEQLAVIFGLSAPPSPRTVAVEGESHMELVNALKTRNPDIADKAIRKHIIYQTFRTSW